MRNYPHNNSQPGTDKLSEKMSAIFEEIARERYPHVLGEPHGLCRAFMAVFSSEDDRKEAVKRFRERYQEGN